MQSQKTQYKFKEVAFRDGQFRLVECMTPLLKQGEILIKVHYSAVNPYDKVIIDNMDKKDLVLGSEGVGVIDQIGPDMPASLIGKKIAFCCDGWSEYAVKRLDQCIMLDDETNLRIAADAYINLLTALCLRNIIKTDMGAKPVMIDAPGCHMN